MKNIKYIISLLLLLTIVSCGDDSFSREYIDTEDKIELTGTLMLTNPSTDIYAHDDVNFIVTLPQAFTVESKVEITVKSTYERLDSNPNSQKIYLTIPAGSTSFSGSFEMPSFDNIAPFGGISEFLSVSITGIALTLPDDGSVEDPYTMTSEPIMLKLLEPNSWTTPNNNTLMLSLDWLGPYDLNDIDLYALDAGFTTAYESSESGDRFEGDFFNNPANENHPDGDYILEIGVYTSADDTPIPYRLVLTHPDGTRDVYEGTVDPTVGYLDPVGFTQVTDGSGVRTFTTYPL